MINSELSRFGQVINTAYNFSYLVCAIPANEMAIHTIASSGALLYNYYTSYQLSKNFVPDQHFTTSSDYKISSLSEKLEKELSECKLNSCIGVQGNILKLKLENSELESMIDPQMFKLYSATYRELCENMGEACIEFTLSKCDEKGFKLLQDYLQDRKKLDISNLDEDSLFSLQRLSAYLGIPDLENLCLKQIVYNIEHSDWKEMSPILNSITSEKMQELRKLIIDVEIQKNQWFEKKIYEKNRKLLSDRTEYIREIKQNTVISALMKLSTVHPAISLISSMAFITLSISDTRSLQKCMSLKLISTTAKVGLKTLGFCAYIMKEIIKLKPVPICATLLLAGGAYACGINVPEVTLSLVSNIASLSQKTAYVAFNILTFIPRTILGI